MDVLCQDYHCVLPGVAGIGKVAENISLVMSFCG